MTTLQSPFGTHKQQQNKQPTAENKTMNPHQENLTPLQRQHNYHKHQKGSPNQVKPDAEENQIDELKSKLHQHLPRRL